MKTITEILNDYDCFFREDNGGLFEELVRELVKHEEKRYKSAVNDFVAWVEEYDGWLDAKEEQHIKHCADMFVNDWLKDEWCEICNQRKGNLSQDGICGDCM